MASVRASETFIKQWFGAFFGDPFFGINLEHEYSKSVPMQRGTRFILRRSVPMQRGTRFAFCEMRAMQRGAHFFCRRSVPMQHGDRFGFWGVPLGGQLEPSKPILPPTPWVSQRARQKHQKHLKINGLGRFFGIALGRLI